MINTKIYKAVYSLSEQLMAAANARNQAAFDKLYRELEGLCQEHEDTHKDHPEQWETLADFTDDLPKALVIYEKALAKATTLNSKDHMSSIAYSMAGLQIALQETDKAIKSLQFAKISANKIADKELKAEIDEMLEDIQKA